MRREGAHEGGVGVACNGAHVDEALVLAERELEDLLHAVVVGDHGLVYERVDSVSGVTVENNGATGVNRKHGLVCNRVTAGDQLPRSLFLGGVLAGENVLVAFFFQFVGARDDFFADGVQGALDVEELGFGRIDSDDETERCGLRLFSGGDGDALSGRVHLDIGIGTDFYDFTFFGRFLFCHLVEFHRLDGLFWKPQKTANIHFYNDIIHKHLFLFICGFLGKLIKKINKINTCKKKSKKTVPKKFFCMFFNKNLSKFMEINCL